MKNNNYHIYNSKKTYNIYNPVNKQIILNFERDYLAWAKMNRDKNYLLWFAKLGIIKYYKEQVFHYRSRLKEFEDMSAKWSALQLLRIARKTAKQYNQAPLL